MTEVVTPGFVNGLGISLWTEGDLALARAEVQPEFFAPGTVDERVEEVVEGKRRIADLVLPKSSSLADLDTSQLSAALGIRTDTVLTDEETE